MALLPIITAPDRRLKQVATRIEAVDEEVRCLMDSMLETMYAAPGVGLAAPQVGDLRRVIVVDVARAGKDPAPICLANPEVIAASDDVSIFEEGCLSLPEQFASVKRPKSVCVRYRDYENKICEQEMDGFLATCVQHEIDHLNGVLFVDHISSLKRGMLLRKLTKIKKSSARARA